MPSWCAAEMFAVIVVDMQALVILSREGTRLPLGIVRIKRGYRLAVCTWCYSFGWRAALMSIVCTEGFLPL